MELKITGRNGEILENNIERFLNLASLICLKGKIPIPYDIANAKRLGRWWYKDGETIHLLGELNNDWLFIKESKPDFIIAEFGFRYDKDNKKKTAISNLMEAFFDFVEFK